MSGPGSGRPEVLQAQGNPIPLENARAGDTDWDISGIGDPSIQGFATSMSVDVGQTVDFKIKTPSTNYAIDIYRIGYYGGAGARKVASILPTATLPQVQPACATDSATGLIDCGNWALSASWAVPADAVSGVYLAKPTRLDTGGGASHIVFIVRNDARKAEVLFQTSDTTWQAYNRYGGASTYCAPSGVGASNAGTAYDSGPCPNRATKVSYNRPFDTRVTSPNSWLFSAEYPMIRFLEAKGYDVKYWSGVDTDRFGADTTIGLTSLKRPEIFLSVGHDEYWSAEQRANVENARNAGVNLSFMSGNELYWKHRWEPSSSHRTLVTYKETLAGAKIDPAVHPVTGQPIWTGTWRDTRFGPHDGGRPENALIGSIWTVNCCTQSIVVPSSMSGMRLWRSTRVANLTAGSTTTLGNETLGYEWGEALENGSQPAGLVRLSSTTVPDQEKIQNFGTSVAMGTATHSLTLYRHNSGAIVFGASSVQWSWGLDDVHDNGTANVTDLAMQQATVNLFADMGVQPGTLQNGADPLNPLVAASASGDSTAPATTITSPTAGAVVENGSAVTITGTATDVDGQVAGVEVSVDGGTTWRAALGTSTWSYLWAPGALGSATLRARATDDSGNLGFTSPIITVSVVVPVCPCPNLWRPSVVPGTASAADTNSWELGVKFRSDIDGFITGIRFYKGPNNTGTHVGHLWTSTGTLIGSATFMNETATGWQQVNFGSPLPITANTTYVASYNASNGGYAFDGGYFATSGVDSPPLHAPASGAIGGNGVLNEDPMSFPNATFGAANYWVDVVFAQSLEDSIAPVISAVKATTIDSARVTVTWTTDEASTSRIDYGTDPALLTATLANLPPGTLTVTNTNFVTQHTVALTGLTPNTTYYQLVSSSDASGNIATLAAPTFTVPGPTLRDTASTDFAAGTSAATYVSQTADGEVILAPTVGAEFSGPTLPGGWVEVPWDAAGYSNIVNGVLLVDGARVATCATDATGACLPGETSTSTVSAIYSAPRSLELSANFSGDQFQHAGFAVTFASANEPWAMFSTLSGGLLFARTNMGNGFGFADTPIGVAPLGEFHRYRIDWKASSVDYYIDGLLAVSHALTVAGQMRPVAASDFNPGGGVVFVDWMRLTPLASPGTFHSRIFDASSAVDWKSIQWAAQTPPGASLAISVRTGDSPTPDGSWSGFVPVAGAGPLNLRSRYIQYRAQMASSDPHNTPQLEDIIISTGNAPVALPDFAAVAMNGIYTFPPSGIGSLIANDTDADANDTLRVVAVTAPSQGSAVVNGDGSVNYTPIANYFGSDAFTYTVSDGLLTASTTVTIDVREGNVPPVANNDFFTVNEDATLSVPAPGILANDTDIENNPLTAILVTFPGRGMLTVGTNGAFTYTPALNYAGPDAFTYRANDGMDSGTIATVQILVNQVNDPPFTEPDAFNAMLNQPLDVPAPGILANDHDVEVEDTVPMHVELVSNVSNGTLTLNSDGSFSYLPNADFLGTDSFTYKAVDHFNAASVLPKTVTLTVAIKAVTQSVASGTVSTGTGVSAGDPLNTAVTTSTPAIVAIAQGVISDSTSPSGYTFLNQQVNITLTNPTTGLEVTATNEAPLVFSFEIDLSLIPAGQTAQTFEIFRNNVRVPNCLGATTIPAANLDPCVSNRSNGTKVRLTVLTTHASHWNLGMETPSSGDDLFAMNDGPYFANYETPLIVPAGGVLTNDLGPNSLTAVLYGTPVGGTVGLASSGAFTFSPAAGFCGAANFSYELHKSPTEFDIATAAITVNCIPTAGADPVTVLEDSGPTMIDVRFNDSDLDGQTFTITGVSQGANGTVVNGMGGTWLSYQPNPNFFGSDSFTYTIQDTVGGTATGTVTVTVTPVNDAPGFTAGAAQAANEDAGAQSVSPWATNLVAGPANEAGQTLTFTATADNPALFATQPMVAANGSLTYTPAPNANGSSNVTVSVSDSGGTNDGGANTSGPQVFAITVTPVNDAPAFTKGANQSLFEDTGAQSVAGWAAGISAGPAEEAAQVLTFNVNNDNPALFSTPPAVASNGALTYDPAPNAVGVANVTVTLSDDGGTANGGVNTSAAQAFTITLNLVNDAPSFTNGADQTVLEDAAAQTIVGWATNLSAGPADETGQLMNFIVSSNNAALFAVAPAIAANGTLSYTPAANAYGSASVTVQLHDNGGVLNGGMDTSAAQTFMIHVTAVNDAPGFMKGANDSVLVNSGAQTRNGWATAFSRGPANENSQTLTFTVGNNNAGLFAAPPAVNPSGNLTYTPAVNATGSATVTVTLQDNGGTANGGVNTSPVETFTITVVQGTTSISVASDRPTALFKVPVTFTATVVSQPAGILSGQLVTFKDGTTTIGSGMLNAMGRATLTTSTLAVGTRPITAIFAGNSAYLGSTSPAISQVIQPSATLTVNFRVHALMDGTNKPRVQDVPVANADIRVYTRRDLCTDGHFVSSNPKKWGVVFDGADGAGPNPGCPIVSVGSYQAKGTTDAAGNVTIIVPPTTNSPNVDYVIIGKSTAFNVTTTAQEGDAVYAAYTLPTISANAVKRVLLHEIRLFNGKRVPGKSLEEYGSYLAIVEPEYLEWTADQELYPFILVAEGDWGVTTSVEPPPGFVADYPELATAVMDNVDAVQFTLTDIGSDWTETKITHTIKHKGKTKIRTSKVPMFDHKPKKTSVVSLVASETNAAAGARLTLTATVASEEPGKGLPSGKVTFMDGDTVLGFEVLKHKSHGSVTITTPALSEGRHNITAVYEGQGSFLPGTSVEVVVTIGPDSGPIVSAQTKEVPPMTVAVGVPARAVTPTATATVAEGDSVQAALVEFIQPALVEFEPIEWTAGRRRHPIRVTTAVVDWQLQQVTLMGRGGGARSAASTRLFKSEGSS